MDYIGELIVLGIDAVIFGVCTKLYLNSSLYVNLVERAQRLGVNPDVQKLKDEDKLYVIFQGDVKAVGKPINGFNAPDYTGVIQRITIKEHATARNASGFWADQKKLIHESYNVVPFILKKGKLTIEILDPVSADILDLDTIHNKFENSSLSVLDHIIGFFNGVRQRGIETTEELLKEGTPLTAIGEVMKAGDGKLQISPSTAGYPYYITSMPVSSLLRKLDDDRATYKWLTILVGSVGIALTIAILKRWWTIKKARLREEELKKRLEESRLERRKNVRNLNSLAEIEKCVVCRENPKEVIVLPCGHVCICENCSESIEETCPVCRSLIENKAAAFIS